MRQSFKEFLVIEKVNNKEISSALKQQNILLGAEYEFSIDESVFDDHFSLEDYLNSRFNFYEVKQDYNLLLVDTVKAFKSAMELYRSYDEYLSVFSNAMIYQLNSKLNSTNNEDEKDNYKEYISDIKNNKDKQDAILDVIYDPTMSDIYDNTLVDTNVINLIDKLNKKYDNVINDVTHFLDDDDWEEFAESFLSDSKVEIKENGELYYYYKFLFEKNRTFNDPNLELEDIFDSFDFSDVSPNVVIDVNYILDMFEDIDFIKPDVQSMIDYFNRNNIDVDIYDENLGDVVYKAPSIYDIPEDILIDLPFNTNDAAISNEYHGSNDYTKWRIEPDSSLTPFGIEIISPVLPLKESLIKMRDMFKFIDRYGFTDNNSGFHINLSFKDKKINQ
jgi:hypothetical protein